jgi:hypothetical protein
VPEPDGSWAIALYLGGDIGTRHAILLGTISDDSSAQLTTFLAVNPDQPLVELPSDLTPEARFSVEIGNR